jgi:hypothetical protein
MHSSKAKGAATIVAHAILEMLFVSIGEYTGLTGSQRSRPAAVWMSINRAEANSSGGGAFLR